MMSSVYVLNFLKIGIPCVERDFSPRSNGTACWQTKTEATFLWTLWHAHPGLKLWCLSISECQTTRPLDNSPQTTRPQSSDSVVDKRTKNNLYDIKSWIFSGSFGLVVDKKNEGLVV